MQKRSALHRGIRASPSPSQSRMLVDVKRAEGARQKRRMRVSGRGPCASWGRCAWRAAGARTRRATCRARVRTPPPKGAPTRGRVCTGTALRTEHLAAARPSPAKHYFENCWQVYMLLLHTSSCEAFAPRGSRVTSSTRNTSYGKHCSAERM